MGIKRNLQNALGKLSSRFKRLGISRTLSNPSSVASIRSRSIEWLYLLILFLLAGGVINAAANAAQPGISSQIIVPSPTAQNTIETFILLFTYIIGALGAYSMFLSGRQTIRARSAEMFFVGGLLLMSVAVTLGYYVLSVK